MSNSLTVYNKPYLTGNETRYINDVMARGKFSGNGRYTALCQEFLQNRYGFKKCLLTTSCTDALEMAALLLDIRPGDEVVMPAYTFVSTANAFALRGANIVFADSGEQNPNIDVTALEALITPKTKALVVVHYAGIACDMDTVMALANRYNIAVVEDAALAIDSFYTGADGVKKALGSIGHLGAFSFHETKNIMCGEGGMLAINDSRYAARAEVIWEKGTNRSAFFRGEVDKYGWVDLGSSFLPPETTAAFLWAQLERLDDIQTVRKKHWENYQDALTGWAQKHGIGLPHIPAYATNNAHIFYLTCNGLEQRTHLIKHLAERGVSAPFHYLGLHRSTYFKTRHDGRMLPHCDRYTDCLFRLPLFYELDTEPVIQTLVGH